MPQSSTYYTDLSLPSLNEDGSTWGTILNQYLEDLTGKLKALSDRINAAGVGTDSTLAQINRDINSVDTINSQLPAGCPDIFPDPYSGVHTTVSTWPAFNTELTALGLSPPETEAEILAFFTGDPSPMDDLKDFFDTRIATINSTLDTAETNIARALRDTCKTNAVLDSFDNRVYVKKYVRQSLPVPASPPDYTDIYPWDTSWGRQNPHEIVLMRFFTRGTDSNGDFSYQGAPNLSTYARGDTLTLGLIHDGGSDVKTVNDVHIANYVSNGYLSTTTTNNYLVYDYIQDGQVNRNGDNFGDYPVPSGDPVGTVVYVISTIGETEDSFFSGNSFEPASTPNGPTGRPYQLLENVSFDYIQDFESANNLQATIKTFGELSGPTRGAGVDSSYTTTQREVRIVKYVVENVAVYDEPDFSSCPTAD